jgi:hypothetical protein
MAADFCGGLESSFILVVYGEQMVIFFPASTGSVVLLRMIFRESAFPPPLEMNVRTLSTEHGGLMGEGAPGTS